MRRSYLTLLLCISGIGLVISKRFQPESWWYYYQGNDSQFFEALGWSLTEWGVFEHPGNLGGSIAAYHWLSYAFFGQLTQLATLDSWDALMKVGPLLIPFATAGVLAAGLSKINSSLFILIVLGSLGLPSRATDSFTFSILIAFTMIYIVQKFRAEKAKSPVVEMSLLLLVSTILIFSKVSTAIVVLAILAIWSLSTCRSSTFRQHLPLLVLGFAGIFWYVLLFRNHPATPRDFRFDIHDAGERLTTKLTDQQFALQLLTYLVVLTLLRFKGWCKRKIAGLTFATGVVTVASIFITIFVVGPAIYYWILPGPYIAVYVAVSSARNRFDKAPAIGPPNFWIILAVFLGFLTARLWNQLLHVVSQVLNLNQAVGDAQWNIVQSNGLIFGSIAITVALALALQTKQRLYLLGIVPVMSLVIGFVIETGRQQYLSLDVHRFGASVMENPAGGNSAPFAGSDLRLVANHIRGSTSPATVLASNNFCCTGDDWWPYARISTGQGGSQVQVRLEPEWSGGANYLLPAHTRRRFLMQGLAFQGVGDQGPTIEQIQRMTLSLQFANSPNEQVASDLKAYGVSGYVVNLSLTKHRDWSEFAIERFRSGNFVYLKLR